MIALELAPTGAAEISVFQRLLPVNGTNPFRLAVAPFDIPLQARLLLPVPAPVQPPVPLDPPEFGLTFDTPEQASRTARAETIASREEYLPRVIMPDMVGRFSPADIRSE